MSIQPRVRRMTLADIDQVHAIELLAFSSPWSKESLQGELTINPVARYLVVEDEISRQIIAYAGIWLILEEGHITNIAVHPDYRRQGYGRFVMLELLKLACCFGVKAATLEVRPSNLAAINLYQSLDFSLAGLRPGYYTDNGEDALILWKDGIEDMIVSEEECIHVYEARE